MSKSGIAAILAVLSFGCVGVSAPQDEPDPVPPVSTVRSAGELPPGPLRGMVIGGVICIGGFLWLTPGACEVAVIGGALLDTANAVNRSFGPGKH